MSLLDTLRQAGSFDSRGSFTLDVEKARSKMARFQLTDPERYILELIAAAFAGGSPELEIDLTPDGLELRFGGTPLGRADLENLEDYLLVAEGTHPALRYLAVGLNALTRLQPRRVLLESPAGVALQLRGQKRQLLAGSFSRHRLVIERGGGVLRKASYSSEIELTRSHVRFSRRPVRLDGRLLSQPAAVELLSCDESGEIFLVLHGIIRQQLMPGLLPVRAVVEDDRFSLNASHSAVVEDTVYQEALEKVEQDTLEELARLAERCGSDAQLLERHRPLFLSLGALRQKGRWRDLVDSLPLFPGPHQLRYSYRELEEQRKRLGYVPVTQMRLAFEPEGLRILHLDGLETRHFLEKRELTMRDVREELLAQVTAHNNRLRWESSPRPRELPADDYAVRTTSESQGVFLAVGIPYQASPEGSHIHVLLQGRLLRSSTLDKLSFLAVLDFDEVSVLKDFSGPDPDCKKYRQAWSLLNKKVVELYRQLADTAAQDARAYDQLLLSLLEDPARSPAARLELLPTLTARRISLDALRRLPRVGVVSTHAPALADNLPPEAVPDYPIVRATAPVQTMLREELGLKSFDARPILDNLNQLAFRLANPRQARLGQAPHTHAFSFDDIQGELRLRQAGNPPRAHVTVLRQGVELEERGLQPAIWPFDAIVDSPRLSPTPDWKRVQSDRAWQEVVDRLREAERDAFEQLATELSNTPSQLPGWEPALLQALAQNPELASRACSLALFPSRGGLERMALAELEAELRQHGRLWMTERDGSTGPRVLFKPDRAALERLLPQLKLELYQPPSPPPVPRVDLSALEPGTKAPPPDFSSLRLKEALELRRTLPGPRFGEVGLSDDQFTGVLEVAGMGTLPGLLPGPARAIVGPHGLTRLANRKIKRDDAFAAMLEQVRAALGELALEAARQATPGSARAWTLLHLLSSNLPGPVLEQLAVLPLVPMHCAPPLSFNELKERLKQHQTVPVAEPGYPFAPLGNRPVVSAGPRERQLLTGLLNRPVRSDHDELTKDEARRKNRRRAAGLKVRLPACAVEGDLQGPELTGRLGLPHSPRQATIILLDGDSPLAQIGGYGLAGWAKGRFELSDLHESAKLSRSQGKELAAFRVSLIDLLARAYPGRPDLSSRRILLEFLASHRRDLGANSPAGRALEQILALSLFPAAGGRLASASALLEEASRGKVAYLERPGSPATGQPSVLPVLRPNSLEWEAAAALVGKSRLERVEVATLANRSLRLVASGWHLVLSGLDKTADSLFKRASSGLSSLEQRVPRPARKERKERVERREPSRREESLKDSPERRLLASLRREFSLLCPERPRGPWLQLVERMGSNTLWEADLLGPTILWKGEIPILNWTDQAVRYARAHHSKDPGCLVLLAAHLFCELNQARADITDEHEMLFLTRLARTLRSSYDADSETEG